MINLSIHTQPDDESCGPTSLHAIYNYYDFFVPLEQIVTTVERSLSGGTLGCLLGKHALQNGFSSIIYVNNVSVFDPTWFEQDGQISIEVLKRKLKAQLAHKRQRGLLSATKGYLDYLELGGQVRFKTINANLLNHFFEQKIPIITGLSATYLYNCARERYANGKSIYDDIAGKPCGHFVILCGYNEDDCLVTIADPHRENPLSHDNYYKVEINRLINAIMLGVLTYDAILLIIKPRE